MDDRAARAALAAAMDAFDEHRAEHFDAIVVDCPICRVDAGALGMGDLLPPTEHLNNAGTIRSTAHGTPCDVCTRAGTAL